MMSGMLSLVPHPSSSPRAVRGIDVHLGRSRNGLHFYYFLRGDIAKIVVPSFAGSRVRRDGLWETTCFEAFLKGEEGAGYAEFNFSPSGDWASYQFDDYRSGMRNAATSVDIRTDRLDNLLAVEARFHADFSKISRLCLSAVVEEVDGTRSHWALNHVEGGDPDFHDDACFAVRLADIA